MLVDGGISKMFVFSDSWTNARQYCKKVMADNPRTVSEIISGDTPFGIPTNSKGSKKNSIDLYDEKNDEHNTRLFYI